MNEVRRWTLACATAFLVACGDAIRPDTCTVQLASGCWTFLGLDGEWVTALAQTPWGLYAGTHDDGVYRLVDNTWQPLGLDHAIVSSLLFVPGSPERLLVGMRPYTDEQTDAAVFASEDQGQTWLPWDGGLAAAHDGRAWAFSLAMDPGNSDQLYMGLNFPIMRSQDGGRRWQFVWGTESELGSWMWIPALLVSPRQDGRVWAGGETALFTYAILCSSDWGDTWRFVDPMPRTEGGVYALAVDAAVENRVFAGGSYGIMRSDDAGSSWRWVLITKQTGLVTGLAYVAETLYAVSEEVSDDTSHRTDLGFYRTRDGGETWDTLTIPDGAGGGEALVVDSHGRLLIGTRLGRRGSGVWRLEPR